MTETFDPRENAKKLAAAAHAKGDAAGWFEQLYAEANGNNEHIPWADLEPNKFLVEFAKKTGLTGAGRSALVIGCGLGDDAKYLHGLGFRVTAFDISETAIKWAKNLHADTEIHFRTADLFAPPAEWQRAFDLVLEVYTIQPLPLELRERAIAAIAAFVAPGGRLIVVTRGRADDADPGELPWPVSRRELARFQQHGLREISFTETLGDEDPPVPRFVVEYMKDLSLKSPLIPNA
jgi:SAM-dependent methyltransferase